MTTRGWEDDAEAVADELRRRAKLPGRVPPSAIAAALGFSVRLRELEPGLDGYHLEGSKRITVGVGRGYVPRHEATIAHELVEAHTPKTLQDREHERFCDRGGAALLLPSRQFLQSLFASGFDVAALRQREWPWASWEALVRRASDLLPGASSAAWVDARVKWRSPSGEPLQLELDAVQASKRHGRGLLASRAHVCAAWSLVPTGARFRAVSICLPVYGPIPRSVRR